MPSSPAIRRAGRHCLGAAHGAESERLLARASVGAGHSRRLRNYNALGDSVWYYSRNVRCVARSVDDLMTVYVAMDSAELVGCELHGLKARRIVEEAAQLGLLAEGEPVKLRLLLLYRAWRAQTAEQRRQYRALAALVGDVALPREELTRPAAGVAAGCSGFAGHHTG